MQEPHRTGFAREVTTAERKAGTGMHRGACNALEFDAHVVRTGPRFARAGVQQKQRSGAVGTTLELHADDDAPVAGSGRPVVQKAQVPRLEDFERNLSDLLRTT